MLDGTGDAAGDVQVPLELLAGHTHVAVQGHVLVGLRHGTAGADGRARRFCQVLDELHVLLGADALARGNHPLRRGDGGVHGDAHGEVIAVLLQGRHQGVHPLLGVALLQDHALAHPGDGGGLLGPVGGAALALGGLAHDGRADDHPLHLVGTLVNGGDLGVPVHPLHIHALEEAGAAEDLHRVVGDLQSDIGGVHLGHGGVHAVGLMGLLLLGGGVHQHPGALQLGGHVRQLEGDGLVEADRLAELDPLLGVLHSGLVGPLGDAQGLGGDADSPAV